MEEFDDAQNVGELLRNTRLKKGKTLGDVSKDLCIRKVYLEAIENLDTKNLPQMPYGLGFVRSYSEYLGLNSARIVQAYRQAAYADEGKEIINEENAASAPEYNGPGLLHICIGLIGIAAVFAIWSGVSSYSQSKQVPEEKEVLEIRLVAPFADNLMNSVAHCGGFYLRDKDRKFVRHLYGIGRIFENFQTSQLMKNGCKILIYR